MPTQQISIIDFTQERFLGVDNSSDPAKIDDGMVVDCSNVIPRDDGSMTTDGGYSAYLNQVDSSAVKNLWPYIMDSGTVHHLRRSSTKVYKRDGATWASIKTGLTDGEAIGYQQMFNVMYWNSPTDGLFGWDGTTVTGYGSAPKGDILAAWGQMLCVSGQSANPRKISFSDVGSPTTYTSARFVESLSEVIALKVLSDRLFVLEKDGIGEIVLDGVVSGLRYVSLLEKNGCAAGGTVIIVENDIYYLAQDALRSLGDQLNYSSENPRVGDLTTGEIRNTMKNVNRSAIGVSVAAYDPVKKLVLCAIPHEGATIANKVIVMLTDTKKFCFFDTTDNVNTIATLPDPTSKEPEVYFGTSTGKVMKFDTSLSHNGLDMDWSVDLRRVTGGNDKFYHIKSPRWADHSIDNEGTAVTFSLLVDSYVGSKVIDVSEVFSGGAAQPLGVYGYWAEYGNGWIQSGLDTDAEYYKSLYGFAEIPSGGSSYSRIKRNTIPYFKAEGDKRVPTSGFSIQPKYAGSVNGRSVTLRASHLVLEQEPFATFRRQDISGM